MNSKPLLPKIVWRLFDINLGKPNLSGYNIDIPVYVDSEIFNNEYFMFNPFNPCKTIRIKTTDLKEIYKNMKNEIKFFDNSKEELTIF